MNSTYKSILVICIGFLGLYLYFQKGWMMHTSLGVGIISLTSTKAAIWIEKGWIGLGKMLGYINSRIILSLLYCLLVMPIAFFYRFSKNKNIKLDRPKGSLWSERNHLFTKEEMNKTW